MTTPLTPPGGTLPLQIPKSESVAIFGPSRVALPSDARSGRLRAPRQPLWRTRRHRRCRRTQERPDPRLWPSRPTLHKRTAPKPSRHGFPSPTILGPVPGAGQTGRELGGTRRYAPCPACQPGGLAVMAVPPDHVMLLAPGTQPTPPRGHTRYGHRHPPHDPLVLIFSATKKEK